MLVMRGVRGLLPSLPPERQEEAIDRLELVASLPNVEGENALFERRLDTLEVDLIVLNLTESAMIKRSLDRFPLTYLKVMETATHAIYLFNRDTESLLEAVGRAQLAFARGDQEAACEQFTATLQQYPQSPLAAAGSGLCQELNGEVTSARQSYRAAMDGLREPTWQMDWPTAMTPWLAGDTGLATELSENIRLHTLEFLQARSYLLDQHDQISQLTESIWVSGWPRPAIIQSAGTLETLETGVPPGTTLRLYVLAEAPTVQEIEEEDEVVISIMLETSDGVNPGPSKWLQMDTERAIDIEMPEKATGRLWLTVYSKNQSARATWFGWHPSLPEVTEAASVQIAPSETALDLGNWIEANVRKYTNHRLDIQRATELAQAVLSHAGNELAWALSLQNLVRNSGLGSGDLAGWNAIGLTPDINFRIEHRQDFGYDWAGVVHSSGRGYQGGWCQTLTVEPGQDYLYLVEAQADLAPDSKAPIVYWDYQRFGQFRSTTGFNLLESTDWSFFWRAVHVPAGVRTLSVCPALLTNAGTVRFDNVWFIPLKSFIIP